LYYADKHNGCSTKIVDHSKNKAKAIGVKDFTPCAICWRCTIPYEMSLTVKTIFKIGEHFGKVMDSASEVTTLWRYTNLFIIIYLLLWYFNVRSIADISQLNLPHGTDNQKV